jgi:hypothetical protein
MFVKALKGKIHRATVTDIRVDYPGSLGVDSRLMEAAGTSICLPSNAGRPYICRRPCGNVSGYLRPVNAMPPS